MSHANPTRATRSPGFLRNTSAAAAVMFAIMAVPVLGVIGIAIDFGIFNEDYATLSLAASSAALNAAKTAASAKAQGDANFLTEGNTSGTEWFMAELGQGAYAATVNTATPTVTVTYSGGVITANVSFTGTMRSIFGRLFKIHKYTISVAAAATMQVAVYTEVVLMLDNSSSMGIGATTADMNTLMQNTACSTTNEWVRTASSSNYSQVISYDYSTFQTSWEGGTYDGTIAYPVVSGSLTLKAATPPNTSTPVDYCDATAYSKGLCPQVEQCPTNVNGYPAYAGPPCAFACHSDSSKAAGLGNDFWALARQKGVTLRLDTLKVAANLVLNAMQSRNNASLNNLSVGVYTFNLTLNPVYPGTGCTPQSFGCEAGSAWTTALGAVGLPPQKSGVYTDTGIQPPIAQIGGNNDNTEVEEAMSNLANNYVTAAGDGSTAAKPRKVLMLITDGLEDDPTGTGYNGLRQAMPSSACQPFKAMGYTVYVIYTPYYPLMNVSYLSGLIPIVEGTGSSSIAANLSACATNSTDYIVATDQSSLNTALIGFLNKALDTPATFTQ